MFDQNAIFALIPLAPFLLGGFAIWARLKSKQIAAQTSLGAEKAAQYAAHTERLEQRVRVLERIVTDKGMDTADQIEALRTAQLPDPRHDQI
jgi:hypothetical protein